MTEQAIAEHNRLYQQALAILDGQIRLHEQPHTPMPGWWSARKLRRAAALFEGVLQINPQNWSAMWFLGKIQQRFGYASEALAWFERCYQINPSQPDVAREASLSAMECGLHQAAIAFADRALQIQPANPGLHANLALAYLLAGHILDAQTAIEEALAGDPSDTTSQTIRTMVQHFAGSGRVPPPTTSSLLSYWRFQRYK